MSYEVNRRLAARRPPLATEASIDAVSAGIIRGAFETICYEVATHLGRSASSAIINQSNERNASIMDATGRLAGISVGIPQLLFISPMAVRYGLETREEDDWGPGDVYVGPGTGGGLLPSKWRCPFPEGPEAAPRYRRQPDAGTATVAIFPGKCLPARTPSILARNSAGAAPVRSTS